MSKIIGIDLGTTNSISAVFESGRSIAIPNSLTQSIVSVSNFGNRFVGESAKSRAILNPDETILSAKRRINGKDRESIVVSAMILQKLKTDAESYLGESVDQAVIAVPASFNDLQRRAV